MFVRYKSGTRYVCAHFQRQRGLPLCQNLPAAAVDQAVVRAFFDVLSPMELDVYAKIVATAQQEQESVGKTRAQQLERLGYQARRPVQLSRSRGTQQLERLK